MADYSSECEVSHRNGFLYTLYQILYEHTGQESNTVYPPHSLEELC